MEEGDGDGEARWRKVKGEDGRSWRRKVVKVGGVRLRKEEKGAKVVKKKRSLK